MADVASTPPRSRRRRWFRLVLVAFVGALALLIAELALRVLWTPPQMFRVFEAATAWWEPEPGTFEPLPGFVGRIEEALPQDAPPSTQFERRTIEIAVNRQGLPGPELGQKRPGEQRVLFGGDSLTMGHGVALADSLPLLAAAALRTRGIDVVAANAGVPGFGLVATCRRLHRLRDIVGADALVVGCFLGNDWTDDILQRSAIVVGRRMFDGPFGNLLRHSARARLAVHSRLALWCEAWLVEHQAAWSLLPGFTWLPEQQALMATVPVGKTAGGLYLDAAVDHAFQPGQPPCVGTWLREVEHTLRSLQATAGALPVLVVVLPSQYHLDAPLRTRLLGEMGLDPALLEPGRSQRQLGELCARLGLPCLDATPVLAAAGEARAVYSGDHLHLSVRGNQAVAAAIAERLAGLLRR
ncbi:MAG: hypothetical protein WAT39_18245 [Planctomycetota bacterium]